MVKIGLPADAQKQLYAGMYANVVIPVRGTADTGSASGNGAILVLLSALVRQDQLTGLYTVSSAHTALLRWVRTGKTVGDKIEVLSGLGAEESFVAEVAGRLYNGAPVKEQ